MGRGGQCGEGLSPVASVGSGEQVLLRPLLSAPKANSSPAHIAILSSSAALKSLRDFSLFSSGEEEESQEQRAWKHGSDLMNRPEVSAAIRRERNTRYPRDPQSRANPLEGLLRSPPASCSPGPAVLGHREGAVAGPWGPPCSWGLPLLTPQSEVVLLGGEGIDETPIYALATMGLWRGACSVGDPL